jgi:hypothetical protein
LVLAAALLAAIPAAALEMRASTLAGAGIVRVEAGAMVTDGDGRRFRVVLAPGLALLPAGAAPVAERRPGMLADGVLTRGRRNLRAVWLTRPTGRYGHGVLGDAIEAGGVAAELADGRRVELVLSADSVFEDLRPRLADTDGDGDDEILVVRSYLDRGAALAVIEAGTGLVAAAQTPPIGRPYPNLSNSAMRRRLTH